MLLIQMGRKNGVLRPAIELMQSCYRSRGTINFGSHDGNLYTLNADGTEKWRFATGGGIIAKPPIDKDGAIYVGSWDKKVYAIGAQSKDTKRTAEKNQNGSITTASILGIIAIIAALIILAYNYLLKNTVQQILEFFDVWLHPTSLPFPVRCGLAPLDRLKRCHPQLRVKPWSFTMN